MRMSPRRSRFLPFTAVWGTDWALCLLSVEAENSGQGQKVVILHGANL